MSSPSHVADTPITDRHALVETIASGEKPKAAWRTAGYPDTGDDRRRQARCHLRRQTERGARDVGAGCLRLGHSRRAVNVVDGAEDRIGAGRDRDTPTAVLSQRSRLFYDYFIELFAQVTMTVSVAGW